MKKINGIVEEIKNMQLELGRLVESKGGIIDSEVREYSNGLDILVNQYYLESNKIKKRIKWSGKIR